ncbi:MAG: PAS domain-containing protein [Myxococcales bacterium]|nr:PAS domain-containing protein [Myxococcales bacterium]
MTFYTLALEITLLLAVWLAIGALQRDRRLTGRLTYAAAAAGAAIWAAGTLLEQRGEIYLLARRVQVLGILTVPALWFGVAAHAVKLPLIRRTPWIPLLLMVPVAPLYALMFAGPWSVLYLPAMDAKVMEVGPLFWWSVAYAWALVMAGVVVLLRGAIQAPEALLRRERVKMALSVLVPLAASGFNIARIHDGIWAPDFTPILIAVTLLAFRRSILSGGVLDVVPVAQSDIIRHLPFGVVLADGQGAVIDLNPAAEELLEMSYDDAVGRALEAVIGRAALDVRIEISSVRGRGGESARFALLEPPKAAVGAADGAALSSATG